MKMGIEGNFKDIGYYNTIDNPSIPEIGLYLIPNEVYSYKIIEGNKVASLLAFYTGSNIVSYFQYPGKVPIKPTQFSAVQKKELINKFSNSTELKKTIEFLNGDRVGPFEDAILFPNNNIFYEDNHIDNPHMISNTKLQFKTINNNYIISEALQFQSPEYIDTLVSSYLEKFKDNRMQYYTEGKVVEYNEFKKTNKV